MFGYYLEVTNSYKDLVPDDYMRKQTLTNAERYITPKLKELEDMILGAEDKLFSLEYDLFCRCAGSDRPGSTAHPENGPGHCPAGRVCLPFPGGGAGTTMCVLPSTRRGVIDIRGGRHPVVEKMISNDMFIANDTYLDNNKNRISIITGPNMAGKSTYMRQTALIVLMAQIGSFVPAQKAKIGIVRPDIHPGGRIGRSGIRPEYVHGGDDRGGQHPAKRYGQQPAHLR